MTALIAFDAGGYSYLKGGFQYSAAVIAQPGFEVERARLTAPAPWSIGKGLIEAHLARLGRPTTALCAVELRSPLPLSEADFVAFNREYVIPLERWGLYRDGANPVARCNLCPAVGAPEEACLYAFSYTVKSGANARTFITSGAAECPDRPNYRDNIVRLGETGPEALREKLRFALGDIEERLAAMSGRISCPRASIPFTIFITPWRMNSAGMVYFPAVSNGILSGRPLKILKSRSMRVQSAGKSS
jgi:hypothetical protein